MQRILNVVAAASIAALALPAAGLAQGANRAKVGTLACDMSAGIKLIVRAKKNVACLFTPSQPGPREVYSGTISKFARDPGATADGEMIWAVLAPTNHVHGALAGSYAGANVGAGANALVGGLNRTITLQPVSLPDQAGINLAAGVAGLQLQPAR